MDRDRNVELVAERTEPWDVIVIGGGATGAGCALDAASRGFSVLLLDQPDFGKGTSSRSTKLIHGGVRYLRQGNIALVRESLRERGRLLKNAPYVVHKQEFIIPCYSVWEKWFYGFGMKIYDLLAGTFSLGRSRVLSIDQTIELLPGIEQKDLKGGVLYHDAQFDDSRLLIGILRTAESHGAVVLNYSRVSSITHDSKRHVDGVEFEDIETGRVYGAGAKAVINAAGIFSSEVRAMSSVDFAPEISYSQGVHLVFDRKFMPGGSAALIPKTSDGRVLFCIPWKEHVLVGTTDTPIDSPTLEPAALEGEIDFILETAAEYLSIKPTHGDIKSVFAGIRPLIKKGATETSALSRGHELFVDAAGLVTVTGGKWTTYRKMAEDAVGKAIEVGGLDPSPCITAELSIQPPTKIEDDTILSEDLALTVGDVLSAVRHEMARTVEDVLARRTRVLFLDARTAMEMAPAVARIIAGELGESDEWMEKQEADFKAIALQYSIEFYSKPED
jgi:glycerol-3-phosphate dehydrogenase